LLVRESGGDNHGVSSGCIEDKDKTDQEQEELLSCPVEANGEVSDGTEDHGQDDAVREFREDLSPEVRCHIVHVVVDLS